MAVPLAAVMVIVVQNTGNLAAGRPGDSWNTIQGSELADGCHFSFQLSAEDRDTLREDGTQAPRTLLKCTFATRAGAIYEDVMTCAS